MAQVSALVGVKITRAGGQTLNVGQAGEAAQAYIETKDLDMGDANLLKWLEGIRAEIQNKSSISDMDVIIKYRDDLDETLNVGDTEDVNGASFPIPLRPPDSQYFRVRFEDNFVNVIWKLGKFQLFGGVIAEDY